MSAMNVYQCIAAVSGEIAREGIGKDRKNEQQGYKFRGIDDVLNTLAPMLARAGLVILPRMLDRAVVERVSQKGGALFNVTVDAEFDFVSAADSSKHTVRMFGEAMDSADKATNKAMSAAYKYAAIQTFCIPTEGDNDADATTHEVVGNEIPQGARDGSSRPRQIQQPSVTEPVATPAGASPSREVGNLITKIDESTISRTNSKPKWFVHFDTGTKASTIDYKLADQAQRCYDLKIRVQPELENTEKWGYNLKRLFEVSASAALPEIQLHADMEAHTQPVEADDIPF